MKTWVEGTFILNAEIANNNIIICKQIINKQEETLKNAACRNIKKKLYGSLQPRVLTI